MSIFEKIYWRTEKFHYTPVKKIIKITEEELSEDIIDDVNKQIGW